MQQHIPPTSAGEHSVKEFEFKHKECTPLLVGACLIQVTLSADLHPNVEVVLAGRRYTCVQLTVASNCMQTIAEAIRQDQAEMLRQGHRNQLGEQMLQASLRLLDHTARYTPGTEAGY